MRHRVPLARLTVLLSLTAVGAAQSPSPNPAHVGPPPAVDAPAAGGSRAVLTGYTDPVAWRASLGLTTLIDFESFSDGQTITNELAPSGIASVSGTSSFGGPFQAVYSSQTLPFPMFSAGQLPSETNFFANDMASPVYGTGDILFTLTSASSGIGAWVADSAPLGNFGIEVFNGPTSLGFIEVASRVLPNSFVGITSDTQFTAARFYAAAAGDSWGLDDVELNNGADCGGPIAFTAMVPDTLGVNVPNSIDAVPVGARPFLGSTSFAVGVDDPSGACGIAPGAQVYLYLSTSTLSFPFPGIGCGSSPGEIMVGLFPSPTILGPSTWFGPGTPAVFNLPVPLDLALCGVRLHGQGLWLDATTPGSPASLSWRLDIALGG